MELLLLQVIIVLAVLVGLLYIVVWRINNQVATLWRDRSIARHFPGSTNSREPQDA